MRIPRCRAFCLRAPGVRFIAFEMDFTGILVFECRLSSLSSCLVQSRRTIRLAVLAISFSILVHRALQTSCKHLNPDTFPSRTGLN
jgi:hypothetical protein